MRSVASFLAVACLSISHLFVKLEYPQDPIQISVAQQRVCDSSTLLVRRPQENVTQTPGRFAYAFIISGCTDTSCLGYVLNAVVAAYVFRNSNSAADMLLMVRMATNHNATHLSQEQESWLHKAGVKLRYLKKVRRDSFGTAQLEKFRVLQLHEDYDRVFFLDADIIPLCNIDYMFQESYRPDGILSDYVAMSGSVAPMTGSSFLVTPKEGEFQRVIDIVRRARERSSSRTGFDRKVGWGHEMVSPDMWKSWWKSTANWTFYGAHCDQGILYMYFKYILLNFTQIHPEVIQTWREVTEDAECWRNRTNVIAVDGGKFLAKVDEDRNSVIKGCGGPPLGREGRWSRAVPYSDFYHFAGGQKPWNQPIFASDIPTSRDFLKDPIAVGRQFWTYFLGQANLTLELELPSEIVVSKGNPLGYADPGKDLFHDDLEFPTRRRH